MLRQLSLLYVALDSPLLLFCEMLVSVRLDASVHELRLEYHSFNLALTLSYDGNAD
jgi:hypothetical protein